MLCMHVACNDDDYDLEKKSKKQKLLHHKHNSMYFRINAFNQITKLSIY